MPFFTPIPPPEPEPEQHRRFVQFPGQPPENWLPGYLGMPRVLARTEDTLIALTEVAVYPQGLHLTVLTLVRPGTEREDAPWGPYRESSGRLRLGVRWADGRQTDDLADFSPDGRSDDGSPQLQRHGGGGNSLAMRHGFWTWPRPASGDIDVACVWPDRGIPETVEVLGADEVADASARAMELWPWPQAAEGADATGWFSYGSHS